MPNESYDVIVVGGGMGGLNLAALLTHAGKKVLILERDGEENLGGRAASGRIGTGVMESISPSASTLPRKACALR